MQKTSRNIILTGLLVSVAFTLVIAATGTNLSGFSIAGTTVAFQYPWRLTDPTIASRLTAWGGYVLHNLIAWGIIFFAQRERPKYRANLRWFNWAFIGTNVIFSALHLIQSQIWYDGLAQDVPEITALGSVALMLMVVILFETPRRGLIFGKKVKFKDGFIKVARKYHGYLFSWAIIYTFWYHPTEGTFGHLAGFFYMSMLFVQSVLIFNRAHVNKYWTFFLEFFVLIHGVLVAIFQGREMWPMFAFGFGAMVVLTQMYGLGLNTRAKRAIAVGFLVLTIGTYAIMGRLESIHEIIRIPALDYMVVGLLYLLYLGGNSLFNKIKRGTPPAFDTGRV
jgi:hypothetical protein